ncbi:LysR family transcriptional regulator [Pseudobacillus wudalianchiensis]|uniref:LysR family transcriptional regulator n=1 Tax=Pseudobacillus wudalianchiensis TaxID=1743143 RepID=A0A1B9B7G0_9BACI|nr:LysR substrate-binding domain-containing protein [Bacillus wudalianchiensis]OCA92018.1 LysR family transcriptional regulator [Bacillus wudalianchiensis]
MTISRYEVINKVVELKSLTKAGIALNLTQPGVSHAINSLESEWGIPLIRRSRSGVQLTSDGERIIKHIRELLRINDEINQEVAAIKGLEIGTVRVGTFASVASQWLPKIITYFQKSNPNIEIELFEGDYKKIEQWLLNNEVDCGFLALPASSKSLNVIPLKKDPMVCIVSNQNPLHKQKKILFSQIEQEPFIIPREGGDTDVTRIFKKHNIKPNIKYELYEDKAIVSMVENNLGINILSEMVAREESSKDFSILELEVNSYRLIGLATLPTISPATEKFIAHVKTWVEQFS